MNSQQHEQISTQGALLVIGVMTAITIAVFVSSVIDDVKNFYTTINLES